VSLQKFELPPAVKNVIAGLEREKGVLNKTISELQQRTMLTDKRLEEERSVVKALEQEMKRMVQVQEQMRTDYEENTAKMTRELAEARTRVVALEAGGGEDLNANADTERTHLIYGLEEQLVAVQNKAREFKDAMHFW